MKTIKSIFVNGNSIEMKSYQGVYYLSCDDLVVSTSPEFDYISSLFDQWVSTL